MPAVAFKSLVPLGVAAAMLLSACGSSDKSASSSDTIKVGAILDVSKGWTSLGKQGQAALKQAADEYKAKTGKTVEIKVIDSAGDAKKAAAGVTTLADEGYKVIIGPGGSAAAQLAEPVATKRGVVLISPGSTSSLLAKSGDSLLRFIPDDRVEAKAIVALMEKAGVQELVPVWRKDLGNEGLHASVTAAFAALRGPTSVSPGVSYSDTKTTGFDQTAAAVSAAVKTASAKGKTAVYLAGFGEASGIVSAASAPATTVTWYGGDGLVGDDSFTKDSKVAAATEALCLPSPQFGLATADKSKWEPVLASLAKANGGQSDAFGVISYDASNVAINTLAGSGSGKSGQELTDAVVATANSTDGASGSLALDSSGDRKTGPYDYWQVTGAATAAKWAVTGGWEPAGGQLGTVLKAPTCP